jgi:MFS family permease
LATGKSGSQDAAGRGAPDVKTPSRRADAVGVTSRYRPLFGVPGFTRLLVSSILGRMPSGMFSLAILLLVRQQTGSFLAAGLAVGAFTLTGAVLSPAQGALADRLGQTRVLLPCAIVQAALLVVLLAVVRAGAPLGAILVVACVAGAFLPPVSGCVRALWSEVAPDARTLESAYSLDAVTQETIYTLGPLLAGSVAVFVSPSAAILLCAAIVLGGTAWFASCPVSRAWRGEARERSFGGALDSSALRMLLVTVPFAGAVIGAIEVGLPALSVQLGSRGSAGVLLALFSIGSMAGGILYTAHGSDRAGRARYQRILLAVELLVAPLVLVSSLPAALLFSVVAGLGIAPMLSCQFSLVGAMAPAGTTTEAFSWHRGVTVAGIALGSALGGWLIDRIGPTGAFALSASGAALACVIASLGRDRMRAQGAAEESAPAIAVPGDPAGSVAA